MKIVLDTNVAVSGSIRSLGPSAQILDLAVQGLFTLLIDERILAEYRDVLRRPRFHIPHEEIDEFFAMIDRFGRYVDAVPLPYSIPDPDDLPFLEVALTGDAECLITGNKKDYGKSPKGLKILSPVEFLEFYRKSLMD